MKNTVFTVMTVLLLLLLLTTIAPMQTAAFQIEDLDDAADDAADDAPADGDVDTPADGEDTAPDDTADAAPDDTADTVPAANPTPAPNPTPPPRWELMRSFSGPDTLEHWVKEVYDISFQDNHTIFYGRGNQLIKWKFLERRFNTLTWKDPYIPFNRFPPQNQVTSVHVTGAEVLHGVGDRLHMRHADNLSFIDWKTNLNGRIYDLDADLRGDYAVGRSSGDPNQYFITDLLGHRGRGFYGHDERESSHDVLAAAIHPELYDGQPVRYFCFADDPDLIRTRGGLGSWGNLTYITGSAPTTAVRKIAVYGGYQEPTRIAALLENDRIDVWNWNGDRLFTFNQNQAKDLYRRQFRPGILEFTTNGELLATATTRDVIFWDMSQREEDPTSFTTDIPSNSQITAIAISANGKILAVGEAQGDIYLYRWTGNKRPAAPAKEAETQPTALLSNYPNPFNPETWIPYQLSDPAEVTVSIYSVDGKLVRTLELGQMPAGAYSDKNRAAYWDGQNEQGEPVASGVYFYTLTAGDFSATRKMVIRK